MTRQQLKEAQLRQAMESLIQYPPFTSFINTLREQKDAAVAYAISHTSVKDERETLCALGEIRALTDVIAIFDAHHQAVEHQFVEDQQAAT